jgi:hypothetical protein
VLLGVAASYLGLTFVSARLGRREGGSSEVLGGLALATLVAIGSACTTSERGSRSGPSFALGELALGTFLIVGFMVHNVTEGLGIAAPIAEGSQTRLAPEARPVNASSRAARDSRRMDRRLPDERPPGRRLLRHRDGRALQVVVEVGRYVARTAPGGLRSGWVMGGFVAGILSCTSPGC